MTERLKKDIIKLVIDEVVIEGESVKIFATIPLPNKIHEREMDKTDIPGTFNARATLGPVNETNMTRIWNKHKQTNTPLKRKVFVALSGGVDSSVSAALLKERNFDVVGVHIKMWSPAPDTISVDAGQADPYDGVCRQQYQDRIDATRVAAHLNIPFQTWDLTQEYKTAVVEYMIREYARGRTPNPDVMCNRHIKFGVFFNRAVAAGADFVATGHYARIRGNIEILNPKSETNLKFKIQDSNFHLLQAKDENKDQSYFLWTLTQRELSKTLFPIGDITKPEVRELARKFQLPTAEKSESQGICFIGEIDVREFLKKYIPLERGKVLTTSGREIGEHDGLPFYTIGQRHGLGIGGRPAEPGEPRPKGAGGIPYYVARKDFQTNTLVVSEGPFDEQLFSSELTAINVQWTSGIEPLFPLRCMTRIRYRQPLQGCEVTKSTVTSRSINDSMPNDSLLIRFDEPQRAIAPGQSVVFYQGVELLGGGIIA